MHRNARRIAAAAAVLGLAGAVGACSQGEERPSSGSVQEIDGAGGESTSGAQSASGAETASGAGSATEGAPSTTQGFTRLQAGTIVDATLTEWAITADPTTMPAGKIYIDVHNDGAEAHELVVTHLGAPDEEGMVAETGAMPSGAASSLAVELPPGQYQFACYIIETEPDGSEEDHYKKGMVTPVTVT